MNFPISNVNIIKQLIPQREPMVMIDELVEYSNLELKSSLTILSNNIFFTNNIFIEGGIIEHMAQSVASHTGFKYYINHLKAPIGYIGTIKKIDIYFYPKLNDKISTIIKILAEFDGVTLVDIKSYVNDQLLAEGEIKTIIAPDQ